MEECDEEVMQLDSIRLTSTLRIIIFITINYGYSDGNHTFVFSRQQQNGTLTSMSNAVTFRLVTPSTSHMRTTIQERRSLGIINADVLMAKTKGVKSGKGVLLIDSYLNDSVSDKKRRDELITRLFLVPAPAPKSNDYSEFDNRNIAVTRDRDYKHGVVSDTMDFDRISCYSCMSKVYESLWPTMELIYKRPMNFTDECNLGSHDAIAQRRIGLVKCDSICVKMFAEEWVGGIQVAGFVRGCFDNILQRGFNSTLVEWYRWLQRDSCHTYDRRAILKLQRAPPNNDITICTCYADGCNGTPRLSTASGPFRSSLPFALCIITVLYKLIIY